MVVTGANKETILVNFLMPKLKVRIKSVREEAPVNHVAAVPAFAMTNKILSGDLDLPRHLSLVQRRTSSQRKLSASLLSRREWPGTICRVTEQHENHTFGT